MLPGFTPIIRRPYHDFRLTAGNYVSAVFGFSAGTIYGVSFGSINHQPVGIGPLDTCFYDPTQAVVPGSTGQVAFSGVDLTAVLAGLSVWVDGTNYPFNLANWTFTGNTFGAWGTSGAPPFADGVGYNIEIR